VGIRRERRRTFDVVIDPSLLMLPINEGNVISGWFWLSGRFKTSTVPKARGCVS